MPLLLQLAPFVLLTGGIAACAYVFLSLRGEIGKVSRRVKRQQEQYEELQAHISSELNSLRGRVAEAEERAGLLVAPAPARSGLNLSKRSQALKMSRIGEKPENIAAALGLPRKEVELLLKVQKMVLNSNDITS
jgi:hypothetical protein